MEIELSQQNSKMEKAFKITLIKKKKNTKFMPSTVGFYTHSGQSLWHKTCCLSPCELDCCCCSLVAGASSLTQRGVVGVEGVEGTVTGWRPRSREGASSGSGGLFLEASSFSFNRVYSSFTDSLLYNSRN